jgi:hypothetical protein
MKELENLIIFKITTVNTARLLQHSDSFQYLGQSTQLIVNEKPDGL